MSHHLTPVIYTRDQHNISRKSLSQASLNVLYTLHDAGFDAMLVGGCIRDLLSNKIPKDFDVVTNATPDQIKTLFKRCRIIGKRFKLVHVYSGRETIEVSTYRAAEKGVTNDLGQVINHNTFGDISTDVIRRDFTINALYYNIADFSIIDYLGATQDINNQTIRMIGNPQERYQEDPVRMLRACRFAAKLNMHIEFESQKQIIEHKNLLDHIPKARLLDEINKLFLSGHALKSYEQLQINQLFEKLFPEISELFKQFDNPDVLQFKLLLNKALKNTDYRVNHNESANISFLYAVLFWPIFYRFYQQMLNDNACNTHEATYQALDLTFHNSESLQHVPMRQKSVIKDIWILQIRFASKTNQRKTFNTLSNKRFRAAYDFLELRLQAGEEKLSALYEYWTQAQIEMPEAIIQHSSEKTFKRKKRRRRK